MATPDEIKQHITRLGGGRLDAGRPEVALLAQLLGDAERLERFQLAAYNGASGVLYLTNERLIFLHRSLNGKLTQQTLQVDDIKHLLYLTGSTGTLQVTQQSTNGTEIFTKLTGKGEAFAEYLRARSQGKTPDEAGSVPAVLVAAKNKTGSPKPLYVITLALALALLSYYVVSGQLFGRGTSSPGSSGNNAAPAANVVDVGDEVKAYTTCKQQIPALLKSPSSADFPFMPPYEPKLSGTTYTIRGYVDAQNSFGAMIRTEWTCSVKYNVSQKNYVVDLVKLLE